MFAFNMQIYDCPLKYRFVVVIVYFVCSVRHVAFSLVVQYFVVSWLFYAIML